MNGNADMKNVELLAPAGTYEAFRAAINAGADAVYLGGSAFGARAYAGNFDKEQLLEALDFAHIRDRKVYLTVNTLLKENEMGEPLYDYLLPFYEAGLDAVIVQDWGVFDLIQKAFPGLDIHASTQMAVTGCASAGLLKRMGATRVVPARELTLDDIKKIDQNVDIEIESFVHGALCYSYSGQCLMSSMLGDRSGNRGRCAQPCRMKYDNEYVLSLKDMCTLELIPQLVQAGVDSFKIEGRMKSSEYVAGVVSVYRRYLDKYLEYGKNAVKPH
ncbi:MAG TPA: peptidase, partial [Bacteroides sp.]|nr:peptidase [Bacteroides sp.]